MTFAFTFGRRQALAVPDRQPNVKHTKCNGCKDNASGKDGADDWLWRRPCSHHEALCKAETDACLEECLTHTGSPAEVPTRPDGPAAGLSGGQQQRVCIPASPPPGRR